MHRITTRFSRTALVVVIALTALTALSLVTASCSKSADTGTIVDPINTQTFVFEVEYINYAWGYRHYGIYVDNTGGVFSYDRKGVQYRRDDKTPLTEKSLMDKYTNVQRIGTVDQATLANKFALSQRIVSELSTPVTRCADAGTWTFWAYTKGSATSEGNTVYEQTLLHRAGDFLQTNRAQPAQELTTWLRTLDSRLTSLPCEN
jgi:hypothetical protein